MADRAGVGCSARKPPRFSWKPAAVLAVPALTAEQVLSEVLYVGVAIVCSCTVVP